MGRAEASARTAEIGLYPRSSRRATQADHDVADRWLLVGLGNPEPEYAGTRHNVGADVVRVLSAQLDAPLKSHRTGARVADTFDRPGGTAISLVLPSGYMNTLGGGVQRVLSFYSAPLERMLIVHDDLDLPLGTLKLKLGGGSGGHNGLRDVTSKVGGPQYPRVRIGIGRPPGRQDPADYVLRPFAKKEREIVDVTVQEAVDAILLVVEQGLEAAQNRFHAA